MTYLDLSHNELSEAAGVMLGPAIGTCNSGSVF